MQGLRVSLFASSLGNRKITNEPPSRRPVANLLKERLHSLDIQATIKVEIKL
jgi:hypothetical protein